MIGHPRHDAIQRVTEEGRRIVVEEVRAARSAMEIGKYTRNAYGDGKLAALENIARRLGVDVPGNTCTHPRFCAPHDGILRCAICLAEVTC